MPEKKNVEWKARWKDEYLEWICGLANAQGGRIYIGCKDNGEVVGVPDAKKLMEGIPDKVRDAMGIIVDVNLLEKDGLSYLEIDVPACPVCISCKGIYYYCNDGTKQKLSGPALESFFLRRRGVSWDNMPFPLFRMEDVSDSEVERFRRLAAKRGRIAPDLLTEPKDGFIRTCRRCGKELPITNSFGLCEECFNQG